MFLRLLSNNSLEVFSVTSSVTAPMESFKGEGLSDKRADAVTEVAEP